MYLCFYQCFFSREFQFIFIFVKCWPWQSPIFCSKNANSISPIPRVRNTGLAGQIELKTFYPGLSVYYFYMISVICGIECVTCNFFLFLCCFRQGWVHVTLRNTKHIGLPYLMSVSSSYFLLLCRTEGVWWVKNKDFHQIDHEQFQNMNKVM